MAEPISSHILTPNIILIQKRRTKEKEVTFCVINCLIPTAIIYLVKCGEGITRDRSHATLVRE